MYAVIALPPVAPAVNARETVVLFVLVGVPIVGACGTVVAVAFAAADAKPVPAALIAETL